MPLYVREPRQQHPAGEALEPASFQTTPTQYSIANRVKDGGWGTMTAYIIASITITDREGMKRYSEAAPAAIKKFGGRYLARGTPATSIEGEFPLETITIVEFPSVEVARQFWDSPEYRAAKKLRENCATGRIALIEGSPGEAPVPGYLR